jgi:hypothetical protein
MDCTLERTFCSEVLNRIKLGSKDFIHKCKVSAFCPSSRIHTRTNRTFQKLERLCCSGGSFGRYIPCLWPLE